MAKVRNDLPQGIHRAAGERENVDGGAFAYYAVTTTNLTPEQLSWFIDNTVTKRLLAIAGVAQVSRSGGVDREIRVELDPGRMQALGLTAVEVNEQLRALNMDAAGGRAQVGGGEQAIRVLGGAKTRGGARRHPGDHSRRKIGAPARNRRRARRHRRGAHHRETQWPLGHHVRRIQSQGRLGCHRGERGATPNSTRSWPRIPRCSMTTIFTTVDHTMRTYHSAMSALVEGSMLAVVVVWFFLRNVRATVISALAIPLSAIPTFVFMQWMGFTLNQITLLGLSLVAGILVDDAIVEIENIVRHMRMGKSCFQAAIDAADEIGLAVVATSFTIIAVFLPVSFMGGVSGQYFKQFGLTVAAAVFISLMVARLITPVLAAYALRSDSLAVHDADGPIMTRYLRLLRWCVANRWKTIAAGAVFFALSVALSDDHSDGVHPARRISPARTLEIELPPGGTLEDTSRVSAAAAAILSQSPEVTDIVEFVGGEDGEIRNGTTYISLVPRSERAMTQKQWEQKMMPRLSQVPDGHLNFSEGGGGRDVQLYLTGDDPALVEQTGRQVLAEMRALPEVRDARIKGDLPRPEIVVHPRLDIAAQLGVSVQSISQTIRIATLGDLPQNGAKFSLSDRQIPIRVSLIESARRDLTTLENLPVPTASGASVPLKSVADLSFGQGPSAVRRYNQSRRVFLEADLSPGVELGTAPRKSMRCRP